MKNENKVRSIRVLESDINLIKNLYVPKNKNKKATLSVFIQEAIQKWKKKVQK